MRTGSAMTGSAVQEMARSEVRAMIGEERYSDIRAHDPHPLFVAMSIAHEGKSFGRIIGRRGAEEGAEKFWPRSRILELVGGINRALAGKGFISESGGRRQDHSQIPVYLFHNRDNSPRRPVGRLVSAVTRFIRGKAHALGIAYVSDPEAGRMIQSGELDTCSIEAELEFQSSRSGSAGKAWIVNAVRKVTGVALGSRALQRPGFAGAGILAAVQEFDGPDPAGEQALEMEMRERLEERQEEIKKLEAEVNRLKEEARSGGKKKEVTDMARKCLDGEDLSPLEKSFVIEGVGEMSRPLEEEGAGLEEKVAGGVRRQLDRLEKLRRYYSSSVSIPSPPERDSIGPEGTGGIHSNPLIPRT